MFLSLCVRVLHSSSMFRSASVALQGHRLLGPRDNVGIIIPVYEVNNMVLYICAVGALVKDHAGDEKSHSPGKTSAGMKRYRQDTYSRAQRLGSRNIPAPCVLHAFCIKRRYIGGMVRCR